MAVWMAPAALEAEVNVAAPAPEPVPVPVPEPVPEPVLLAPDDSVPDAVDPPVDDAPVDAALPVDEAPEPPAEDSVPEGLAEPVAPPMPKMVVEPMVVVIREVPDVSTETMAEVVIAELEPPALPAPLVPVSVAVPVSVVPVGSGVVAPDAPEAVVEAVWEAPDSDAPLGDAVAAIDHC
jgi:nicotinate-nucleotide--dimethylbenzimidazole phosphoribosyltransferase